MSDTPRKTSEILRVIIQASPLAIITLDTNDRVTTWNPAAERVFGWSEAEVLRQRPPFVPDDKQEDFLAVRERERAGEYLNGLELRCQRKDGTSIDVRLWTAPMRDAGGRITEVVGMLEDVTDRRRAEAALRESEAQRELVLQNIPVVLYRAQASSAFAGMWVSENVEHLTGFPAVRFTAEPGFWASRLHPEDRDAVFAAFEGLQENASATCQYRWQCADGTYRWFLDQTCLHRGHGQGPPEFLGTWLDITERKQTENLVRVQRDLALALASTNSLEEGLRCCLDTACEITHLDAGGFYLVDETTGALDLRIHRGLSPAFVRSVTSFSPESKNAHVVRAGKPVYAPYLDTGLPVTECERREGLSFLAVIPVLFEGRVIGCLNVASHVVDDVSETARNALEAIGAQIGRAIVQLKIEEALRASDERFRRLAADTDTGLVVVDGAGMVLEANEPFLRLTGHKRTEEIVGHSVLEWTAPEAREHNAAAVVLCARQGHINDFETIYLHNDGRRVHVLINAIVQHDDGTTRLVSYCKDITEHKEAEAKLAQRTRQLEAIRTVTLELTQTLEVAPLLNLILRRATELVGVRSGALYLWEEAAQELRAHVRSGPSDPNPPVKFRLGEAVAGTVAFRRQGLIVNEFRTSPYATPWFLEHTTHTAVLAEPLVSQERLLGVIVLSNFQMPGWVFSDEDQNLLRLFAAQASIAIRNAELFQAAERERYEIEIVAGISRSINASLDLGRILQTVADGARELTRADLAYVALQEAGTDAMVFRYGAGVRHQQYENHRIEPGKGLGGQVLVTGTPFRTAHYAEEPRITKDYLAVNLNEGVVAELAVPIRTAGRIEGLLYVANRAARPFTTRDERTLQQLADHAAVALQNARLFAQVSEGRAQLSSFTQQLVSVQEEERRRLSGELHDNVGQALTALRFGLDLIREDLPADAVALHRQVGEATALAESITDQVRGLAHVLRPPALERLGLNAALEGFCREFSQRTHISVVYSGRDLPGLRDDVGIHLYRLVQEALTNVGKHAQVDRARVVLGCENEVLSLSVEDDGVGFDAATASTAVPPQHLGLLGMRERVEQLGGLLEITSQVGKGTRVLARVPWKGIT